MYLPQRVVLGRPGEGLTAMQSGATGLPQGLPGVCACVFAGGKQYQPRHCHSILPDTTNGVPIHVYELPGRGATAEYEI